jgi:predicted house-cleaning noncanonical NTP pyrophosphatase (MazG superfamily)
MIDDEAPRPEHIGKLVRDKIPQIPDARFQGTYRQAESKEMKDLLCQKLLEEVMELRNDNNAEEAADVKEVMLTIAKWFRFSFKKIQKLRRQKFAGPYTQLLDQLVKHAERFNDHRDHEAYADLVELGVVIGESSPVFTPDRVEEVRKIKLIEKGGFDGGWVYIPEASPSA